MTKVMLLTAALAVAGCAAPLHKAFYEDMHLGDTRQGLEEKFGIPIAILPNPKDAGSTVYVYKGGGDVCGAGVSEDKIIYLECVKDGTYMSPTQKTLTAISLLLTGFVDGFNEARQAQSTTNCVSNRDPATGSYFTNCHQ